MKPRASYSKNKILLIDHYDSFVFNILHLFQLQADTQVDVVRSDFNFLSMLEDNEYDGVILGPGPGSPVDDNYFGYSKTVITDFVPQGLPVLGICLGFQGIYHHFGGQLCPAKLPIHGKVSQLEIKRPGVLFQGIDNHTNVMRYHSLMADPQGLMPDCFHYSAYVNEKPQTELTQVLAQSQVNGSELMGIEHKEYPLYGIQFHPESFATECGVAIATNFLSQLDKLKKQET